MKVTQKELVSVIDNLTEQDFKEVQELAENLGELFEDNSLQSKVDPEKLESLQILFEDYEDRVCLALLVSKLSKEV